MMTTTFIRRSTKTTALASTLFSLWLLIYSASTLQAQGFDDVLAGKSTSLGGEPGSELSQQLGSLAPQQEFLPVDEAYQLSADSSGDALKFGFVIADEYYLYGGQFDVAIGDESLDFSKPAGKIQYDEIFEQDVEKHRVFVDLSVAKDLLSEGIAPAGEATQIAVRYQGCADAGLCYPPQTRYFTLSPNQASLMASVAPAVFQGTGFEGNDGNSLTAAAAPLENAQPTTLLTLLKMMFYAMIGGLILNLMPCVLPVLSLKALSFSSGHNQQEQRLHGWVYTLGVISTFALIASLLLAIRAGGTAIGWGFQLQTPWFVSLLILLFVAMGLSLSGLIEFGGRWMGAGQQLTQGSSLKSSYFTGVLATVVASPCTAPLMASALGFALTQATAVALAIFISLGFGMALPFLLLAHLPWLGKFLPKPGAWMETFKQALAFPLYLTAIWLLWVLGRQKGIDTAVGVVIAVLLLVFIYWLAQHASKLKTAAHIAALALVAFTGWSVAQQADISKQVTADSDWEEFTPQRLADLRQQGQPVFINMTADWCITCIANEKVVFTDATVERMKQKGIVLMKGDWTHYDPKITRLLEEYGRGGVPLYLLFPAEANAQPAVLPQILTPAGFSEKIGAIQTKHTSKQELSQI